MAADIRHSTLCLVWVLYLTSIFHQGGAEINLEKIYIMPAPSVIFRNLLYNIIYKLTDGVGVDIEH